MRAAVAPPDPAIRARALGDPGPSIRGCTLRGVLHVSRPAVAAAAFAIAVCAFGAFGWVDAERRALAAAAAEARALLRAVAAGIESNLDASRAVTALAGDPLAALVPEADALLAQAGLQVDDRVNDRNGDSHGGRADAVLAAFVEQRGLRGAVWLGDDLAVRGVATRARRGTDAGAGASASAARVARIEAEALARRAADAGLPGADRADLGLRDSPFGARTEVSVAVRARTAGGFVLLRADAGGLERFRREAGIERLLAAAGASEGIVYLAVADAHGRVAAAHPESLAGTQLAPPDDDAAWRTGAPGARVLDVAIRAPWSGDDGTVLRAGLVAAPVEHVIDGARRGVALGTLLLLATGPGGLLLLAARARRSAVREAALRREIDERERFAALGRLAAAVAHEVRSPLNALSMATQRLPREARPADAAAAARFDALHAAQVRAIGRIERTVEEFVGLAREDAPLERTSIDVGDLVAEVLGREEIDVEVRAPAAPVRVTGDRGLLGKAVVNLVRNAVQCAPRETVSIAWRREGDVAVIEVDDGGPGIPPADREAVFAPFRTQRPGGLGLGLTIARDAVRRHAGDIVASESPRGGARFVVRLPAEGVA